MNTDYEKGIRVRLTAKTYADDPWKTGDEGTIVAVDIPWVTVQFDNGVTDNVFRHAIEPVDQQVG